MALTVYGRNTSINVQKVLWALDEMGKGYQRIDAGGSFGGIDTPEFLNMNPHGKIPVLRDGDLAIWESNAIVRYLSRSYGKRSLQPKFPSMADQWMDWTLSTIMPDLTIAFHQEVRTIKKERDEDAKSAAAERLGDAFKVLDNWLDEKDFVMGKTLSMADIVVGSTLYRYFTLNIDRPELANVERYYETLQSRDAYVESVMTSYEPLRVKEDAEEAEAEKSDAGEKASEMAKKASDAAGEAFNNVRERFSNLNLGDRFAKLRNAD